METRQRSSGVDQLARRRVTDADAFLAVVRKEQARFIEALAQAAALLGRESRQLEQSLAAQTQLTRQFLDAQRSILQLRADTDKELALIGTVPGDRTHAEPPGQEAITTAQKEQLAAVLDQWWVDERELRRAVIDEARRAVRRYLARLEASDAAAVVALPTTTTRVLAELDSADAADLHSLLDELIHSLDPTPASTVVSPEPVAVDPNDLRFIDVGSSEAFVEFWAAREPTEPVVVAPRRWRALLQAVYPVAAVASLLTVAMAWMG